MAAWSAWSKHMPGHGRAKVDTHYHLPTVTASDAELEIDLAPFRALAGAPMGMTSHIIFQAWDPDRPATLSPVVIEDVIRRRIGFDGLLMTDDIDMKALTGSAGRQGGGRDRGRLRPGARLLGPDGRDGGYRRAVGRNIGDVVGAAGAGDGDHHGHARRRVRSRT